MSTPEDLVQTYIEIQDYLVPKLDTYEQALYHYIVRHTLLIGRVSAIISVKGADIGLGKSKAGSKPSESVRQEKLRSLVEKGCIEIVEKSNRGTEVRPIFPRDIQGLVPRALKLDTVDLEALDFYEGRAYVDSLLARENHRCFYTLQKVTRENCILDHVIPRAQGGSNSYRNIVVASFDTNSLKSDSVAQDFARRLYRDGMLELAEFQQLLEKLVHLQEGKLVPSI